MVAKKIGLFLAVVLGLFIILNIAEKAGVPNYDLPFGWHAYTYDSCTTQADYNTASKHCHEVCPQTLPVGTRGNGFPFTGDYSDCDVRGGRSNVFAAPLNILVLLTASTIVFVAATRQRGKPRG